MRTGVIFYAGSAQGCSANVDCAAAMSGATVVSCADASISPGLINTHEHITFSQQSPSIVTSERYEHRHDWPTGKNNHTKIVSVGAGSAEQVQWAELRHLMAGTTSITGSGSRVGLLRNFDSTTLQEGLDEDSVRLATFPLDDPSGTTVVAPSCMYGASRVTPAQVACYAAYLGG